jgi:hypothetical protein
MGMSLLHGTRHLSGMAILPILAVACGGGGGTSSAPAKSTSSHEAMMSMQPGAAAMNVAISSPSNGTMVTANSVELSVRTTGFDDTCALAGKEDQPGKGHYHVLIDKALVNMFCTPTATVSMQNIKPGMHTLSVVPAQDDHAEVEMNAQSINIDYEPSSPLRQLTDATFSGAPSIKILSPKPGTVLSGPFDVVVQVTNFNLSCDLLGKPDVAGYGHWHLNVDADTGPMMGMGTMFGMSCVNVFHATTEGLQSGTTHTLIALLVDNGHAPFHPDVADKVEVRIG